MLPSYPMDAMKNRLEKSLTVDPSQIEVVTLAVYLKGGAERAVDTEDVAVEANRLAPGRFAWRKYPDQINLELVRVYLSAAKSPDRGEMLIGSGRTGWRLTRHGLQWVERAAGKLDYLKTSRRREQSRSGSIDEQRWRRERARIQSTSAWKLWSRGNRDIPAAAAKEVFRIDSYATGDLREAKITRVRSLFSDDEMLKPFLDHIVYDLDKEDAT
jgi:hypothetical protein